MYQLSSPAAALRPWIEHFWFVSHPDGEQVALRVDAFVDARADLIFNFEAPYLREVIGSPPREVAGSNLDAQRLVPIRIRQHGMVRLVGVRFRLAGLAPFTTERLERWNDATPEPRLVFGPGSEALEAALRSEPDMASCTVLLDDFFLARLRIDDVERAFHRALTVLQASPGRAVLADLADAASVSPRQVQRLFARCLGFPPRTIARVLRFQEVLRRLMVDPRVPLSEVAADAGYFDQAHLVRDFRAFTGGVPRGYRGYYPADGPTDFAPNVVAYVQDPGRRRSGH